MTYSLSAFASAAAPSQWNIIIMLIITLMVQGDAVQQKEMKVDVNSLVDQLKEQWQKQCDKRAQ